MGVLGGFKMPEDNLSLQPDVQTPEVGVEQPAQDSTQVTPAVEPAQSEGENFDFGIDEDGNVVFSDGFGEKPEETDGEEEPPEKEQAQEPATYKVKVNGEELEVPLNELLNGYMRQADFTQKTQALADQRRSLEAPVQNQQPQQQIQPQQQQQVQQQAQEQQPTPFTQKNYYEQLANYAKTQVQNNMGEDFDEFNPVHIAALADEVTNVKAHIIQTQQAQMQEQQAKEKMQNDFNGVYNKYSQDPNFHEIDNLAQQRLEELPYKQAKIIQQAFDTCNTTLIDQYMAAVRDDFYHTNSQHQVQNPIKQAIRPKVNPPYIESGGTSKPQAPVARQIDYSKLGNMTTDQQAQVFSKLGLTKL